MRQRSVGSGGAFYGNDLNRQLERPKVARQTIKDLLFLIPATALAGLGQLFVCVLDLRSRLRALGHNRQD